VSGRSSTKGCIEGEVTEFRYRLTFVSGRSSTKCSVEGEGAEYRYRLTFVSGSSSTSVASGRGRRLQVQAYIYILIFKLLKTEE
jgi:hypothetical protein